MPETEMVTMSGAKPFVSTSISTNGFTLMAHEHSTVQLNVSLY